MYFACTCPAANALSFPVFAAVCTGSVMLMLQRCFAQKPNLKCRIYTSCLSFLQQIKNNKSTYFRSIHSVSSLPVIHLLISLIFPPMLLQNEQATVVTYDCCSLSMSGNYLYKQQPVFHNPVQGKSVNYFIYV